MQINTGSSRLMRISLLQFFKIFHKYLSYANFGLIFSLVRFLGQTVYFANAILSFFIFLLRSVKLAKIRISKLSQSCILMIPDFPHNVSIRLAQLKKFSVAP